MRLRCVGSWVAIGLLLAFFVGCGSNDLGQVSGTVTLDGEPLEGALVLFTPIAGGRPTAGRTNARGRYELVYDRSGTGAILGEHVVEIRTADEISNDDDTVTEIPEKVPSKYNFDTELRADVKEGNQTFDFALESVGEIITEGSAEEAEAIEEAGGAL